ncbi:ORMDL family protein [Prunus dulcis]|uniref:ORMDL family protein n=1 Tax=Prunus dulcis TaxID=3755 RepID=A0A4Y1RHG0_PRUDU|nr:ORMDL family protein [Prunus dulcis]
MRLLPRVTYHFFHWKKGTPFADDQGIYNALTWWEQIDNGNQLTRNRKFLTVVPVVLYLIASHTTDYQNPNLIFNTLAVFVLVVAKFPNMHKMETRPVSILVLFTATLYGAIGLTTHSIGLGQNGIIELKFPDYFVQMTVVFSVITFKPKSHPEGRPNIWHEEKDESIGQAEISRIAENKGYFLVVLTFH